MRRTYISPEFIYNRTFGTYNMKETSNLFASKMLEIEDEINLHDQNLVYYQNERLEQIDFEVERTSRPNIYSLLDDKRQNSNLIIDDSQNQFQRDGNTKWILNINMSNIFQNYLFAVLKQSRTFEGLRRNMTSQGNIDISIKEYITYNLLNRYRFDSVKLYLKYNDLRRQIALRYKNNWTTNVNDIYLEKNKLNKFETVTAFDYSSVKLLFAQEKSSQFYNFDYYYTILWKKL